MAKLLVVDDEIEICDFLKSFFIEKGFDVDIACDGNDALKLLDTSRPQVVLLDIRMPGMNGIEVLKKIKEIDSNIKVIMVTGIDSSDVVEEAKEAGASDYIIKPFSLNYLEKNVINKILSLS